MAKNLPSVTSPLPPDLKMFIQRVREALDGTGLDSVVTTRQLVAQGVISTTLPVTPTAPQDLLVVGSSTTITLNWTKETYAGHGHTEVWAAEPTVAQVAANEVPLLDQAVKIGMSSGTEFSHAIGSAKTVYYWIRHVSKDGIEGPFNLIAGSVGTSTAGAGTTGASTDIIFIRAGSAPSAPSPSANTPSGWSTNPPSSGGLLYASSGVKAVGATNFTWGTPFQIEGESIAEVAVYRLNSNAGLSAGSFNFTNNTLTPPSGWSTSAPSLSSNGDIVYRASGLASGSVTDTAASVSFGSAVIYARKTDGADGASVTGPPGPQGPQGNSVTGPSGDTVVTGRVYYNSLSATQPSISNSGIGFNFSTGLLTGLPTGSTGWSQTQPSVSITNTTLKEWSTNFTATSSSGSTSVAFGTVTGAIQVTSDIESDNFQSGSSGWRLQRNGNAEFESAVIRDTISASKLQIDNVTLDTDGSGNLIIKNSGVATGKIAAAAVSTSDVYTFSDTTITNHTHNTLIIDQVISGLPAGGSVQVQVEGWIDGTAVSTSGDCFTSFILDTGGNYQSASQQGTTTHYSQRVAGSRGGGSGDDHWAIPFSIGVTTTATYGNVRVIFGAANRTFQSSNTAGPPVYYRELVMTVTRLKR